jgi:hypothetical protein
MYILEKRLETFKSWPFQDHCFCTAEKVSCFIIQDWTTNSYAFALCNIHSLSFTGHCVHFTSNCLALASLTRRELRCVHGFCGIPHGHRIFFIHENFFSFNSGFENLGLIIATLRVNLLDLCSDVMSWFHFLRGEGKGWHRSEKINTPFIGFKPGRPKAIFEMLPTVFEPYFCFTVFGS